MGLQANKPRAIAGLAALLAAALTAFSGISQAAQPIVGEADRMAKLLPAVVNIETITVTPGPAGANGQPGPLQRGTLFGSGFIIDPSGLIVTNRHVIQGGVEINVTGDGIPMMKATPIFIGGQIDIAVLKVTPAKPLTAVTFGDSDKMQVADPVLAVGNPLGIGESVSSGIVSALNRNLTLTPYDDFIQTDAAINHGNSGGPLFNLAGEVIGIDTALYAPGTETGSVGLGFALPSNIVTFIVDQVRSGHVHAGYLGLHAQPITMSMAAALGFDQPAGAIVYAVDKVGPATGKIQVGDVILKADDQDVSDVRAAARYIAQSPLGRQVNLLIWRNGKQQTVTVTVVEMPNNSVPLPKPTAEQLAIASPTNPGVQLSAITPLLRSQYGLDPDQRGVVITSVSPNGYVATMGLAAGAVILRLGLNEVNTPDQLRKDLEQVRAEKRSDVLVLVRFQGTTRWYGFPLNRSQPSQ